MKAFKIKWPIYLGYTVVFLLSFWASWAVPLSETFKIVVGTPALGALCLLLVQLWRDDRSYEREVELQARQQDFVLGTASHMAQVAYDKHVKFCEEYVDRIQQGFQELMKDGPTEQALNIGGDLVRIRLKHATWLTKDIETKLKPIEQALIKIGAKESLLRRDPNNANRSIIVDEIYRLYELVMAFDYGEGERKKEETAGVARDEIIEHIRGILGVNELTKLRLKTTELALSRISKSVK